MEYGFEPWGHHIREMRRLRKQGLRFSEIVDLCISASMHLDHIRECLWKAFLFAGNTHIIGFDGSMCDERRSGRMNSPLLPKEKRMLDKIYDSVIDERVAFWDTREPYTDVIRPRDRRAFIDFCDSNQLILFTRVASHLGAPYVGQPGYRPMITPEGCAPRLDPPNQGLLALDRQDGYLVEKLRAKGISVSEAGEGHVLFDEHGRRFFETYQLMGLYSWETKANVWTPETSRILQADLNARFRECLIVEDPWDIKEPLDTKATFPPELSPPFLMFLPKRDLERSDDINRLEKDYSVRGIPWPYAETETDEAHNKE